MIIDEKATTKKLYRYKRSSLYFDFSKFILLIDIEDSSVNLRKDLKKVFKNNYLLYYEKKLISQKWQIDSQFAIDMFCSIALTFLESSIKNQNQEQMKQNTAC
ncbi:hypothetical protein VBH15_05740 [Vagococcus fluvialis]|uniref:Uncharacterized protein n=1 Tax=Vagococcus fluvialis TaxID=2738 RepID=A0A7X6D7Y0_9ENTE|nr:hypothetical protein [Vagococcus fluvialis]MDT2782669.1 hypothetical protein [Vagococcus fluvialis]NKC67485.1 hypothetical protein [Vagococcus fluvialis]